MRLIGLLDCNNFFVSCERLFRPDLEHRPVIVLSGNDGCVVARSNEVKDLGVPMGVPYFQVRELLQKAQVTIFSSNFTLYRDISRRVMCSLSAVVDTIEPYSIDEAFFELEVANVVQATAVLTRIKTKIEQTVGVPVSVGAGMSKTIAKLASEKEKRGCGVCVLTGQTWVRERPLISLSSVWGVGGSLSRKFREQGLYTIGDLVTADRERVAALFGVVGCRLYDELSQTPVHQVAREHTSTQKSIMSTRSFRVASNDKRVVRDALAHHVQHVAAELRALNLTCQSIQVIAQPSRHGDWVLEAGRAESMLPTPTNDTRELLQQTEFLLETFFNPEVPYKKAGVVVGQLRSLTMKQPGLFEESKKTEDDRSVMQVFDEINNKYGYKVMSIGQSAAAASWKPARDYISPRYTTNWNELVSVRA